MKANINDEKIFLINKAKNNDLDSLEKLLKLTEKEVYSFLFYLTTTENEVSDIVQEVLVKIVKNLKNLKNPSTYNSWVNKIVLRQYFDHIRKNKKYEKNCMLDSKENEENFNFKDTKCEPIENCINKEIFQLIQKSISKINNPYKITLLMREFSGLSYEEIAKLTKTNIGTVKSRINRARNQLKEYIKPYME